MSNSAGPDGGHEGVAAVIVQLYKALGDRPAFDRHLHEAITIWESDADDLLHGTAELDALRDRRATTAAPAAVAPESLKIDTWGDTAVARYVLRAVYDDHYAQDECFRVTDVLRRVDERWLIVHHHSEALASPLARASAGD
jgi:ketosteroid isomerase-like protein